MSNIVSDEIVGVPSGARFYRTDLHIHSFGASHDVKDAGMTPKGIVERAVADGLSIIAVTDHNEIGNVESTIGESKGRPLLVIPGTELSTPQGHLLAYFAELADLKDFYGKLDFADRGTGNSRCQTAMLECLKLIDPSKGFAILAHVDDDGGLEKAIAGQPQHKGDILCQGSLLGIELRNVTAPVSYSAADPDAQRAAFGQRRIAALSLGSRQFLARVIFSDSHSLSALGKNAQGNRRVTRVKMDSPSFDGLRIALQDADARIRLEDEIPQSVPYLMGLKIEGGFLDGQTIHFSRNLNCIIGGRGAGKSTAFESVRCAAPRESSSPLIDCEVWPQVLHLVWVDEAGQQHTIRRCVEESPQNLDDPDLGPLIFPMECYGQGETAQTSARARTDPSALLEYLDSFVPAGALFAEDEELRNQLLNNQTEIEKAELEVSKIPQFKRFLATTQQQLQALEKAHAKEVVVLERKVAEERSVRTRLEEKIGQMNTQAKQSDTLALVQEIREVPIPAEFQVGGNQYQQIRKSLNEFETKAKTSVSVIVALAKQFVAEATKELQSWKSSEQGITGKIESMRKQLASQGIKLDLAYIRKLASDEAAHTKSLGNLKTWEKHLKELRNMRAELLEKRRKVRSSVTTMRTAFAVKASKALEGALGDLHVSLKYQADAVSPEAEEIIQQAMGWRTVQVPRAAVLVEKLTVPRLLDAIQRDDAKAISELADDHGSKPFSIGDAREIVTRLGESQHRFALERCPVQDRPKLTVTKSIQLSGKTQYVARDFARLSLGQQQSVLLALMLSSDSSAPLIIDQPEDNLDGEFIYHSLVPVLRRAKERRQVIVVTHNANIAVLGDAEQIIALKSTSDKSLIVARGSIDDPALKRVVCQILEGSEEAFRRRARIYGVK
jgi:energy-coupling factor transporter ATP-binding protein EcfA2